MSDDDVTLEVVAILYRLGLSQVSILHFMGISLSPTVKETFRKAKRERPKALDREEAYALQVDAYRNLESKPFWNRSPAEDKLQPVLAQVLHIKEFELYASGLEDLANYLINVQPPGEEAGYGQLIRVLFERPNRVSDLDDYWKDAVIKNKKIISPEELKRDILCYYGEQVRMKVLVPWPQNAASILEGALGRLLPREREVLRRRFGLDVPAETLKEIGERMGFTKERIRQIESKALRVLRLREELRVQFLSTYEDILRGRTAPGQSPSWWKDA